MASPSPVLGDPVLLAAFSRSGSCGRQGRFLLCMFIGIGIVLLNGHHIEIQAPTVTLAKLMRHGTAAFAAPPSLMPRIPTRFLTSSSPPIDDVHNIALAERPYPYTSVHVGASASTAAAPEPLLACYSDAVGGRSKVARILSDGEDLVGETISVCGWVKTKREAMKGAVMFLEVNDGSCQRNLQVVVDKEAKGFETVLNGGGTGSSVKCKGKVVKSQGGKQAIELLVKEADDEVVLFGSIENPDTYALQKGRASVEFLREHPHLRPRSNLIGGVTRIRSALAMATHNFFNSRGFLYVHTPLITASDCEGAGEMFQVTTLLSDAEKSGDLPRDPAKTIDYTKDFFGKKAFLTVSGQVDVEPFCCSLSNVYTFGPTFRSENSQTSRHLAEFWMIEPELAFADINDDMQCAEDYLKACVSHVMENNMEDLEFFNMRIEKGLIERLKNILAEPFARISYTEAIDILKKEVDEGKAKFEVKVEWGIDMGSEHERWLVEQVTKKPTIVYNYPKDIKAFYMRLNDDGKTVAAMDLLVPRIGELIGGSQREERLDVLSKTMTEKNLEPSDYKYYLDLRRFGSVPHAGFGLGFERLIMLCTGVENIRDVIPYPRYPKHVG
eukprot:gnl/TRDRNA2_/TRDRNA2_36108_c0_seq1.p1 gnl/TRDRNA2_/TRDRNA2_36108_c0~~gnl/TRDRNA2_/TRDRNA2_36108_c0_seq1.p1  ORF type:complete len:611 (+),score=101.86 gnl/TRDRNA2_/TRDRNA2_36108_c0_seq1:18-1850(+)